MSLQMDEYEMIDDYGMIELHIHHGGKFVDDNDYIGGKETLIDQMDYSVLSFCDLNEIVKGIGYHSVVKWGFRGNGITEKFDIFYDEEGFCQKFVGHIDFVDRCVKVYCECLSGDLTETLSTNVDEAEEDTEVVTTSDGMETEDFSFDDDLRFRKHHNKGKTLKYVSTCDHKSLIFEVGMCFKDSHECKEAVKMWAILNGHNIKWSMSNKQRQMGARCEGDCPWRLYASKLAGEDTFVIKTLVSEHTCTRAHTNRQANCDWLVSVLMHDLERNPNYKAKKIVKDIQMKYGVTVLPKLCYKAKWKALKLLRGGCESHYAKLKSYILELQRVDKEGMFGLNTWLNGNGQPVFQRCYIGFSAL